MRRTIFLALVAALLLVAAAAHAADPIKIIRDCEDDGALQGDYTASELRKARDELPTDIDEYSDCRDVLSRAIADKTASSGHGGGSSDSGGTSNGGSNSGSSSSAPDSTAAPSPTPRPAIPPGPPTEADTKALAEALNRGPQPVEVGETAVSPGQSRLAASVGRNSVPSSLFAVFGLLVVTGLIALGAPLIRRRVSARNQT